MAVEKIILATKKFSNNWWSVTTNTGREINICTINKKTSVAENQKLHGILTSANTGDEVEIDVREWETKFYGNDPKSAGSGSGTKTFTSDKPFDAAKISAQAASTLMSLSKEPTFEKWQELAEKMHTWILSKKS